MECTEQRKRGDNHGGLTVGMFVCRQCHSTAMVIEPAETEPQCHDEPMDTIWIADRPVSRETLSSFLADAFDIPQSGSEVCWILLQDGIATRSDIAARIGRDPQIVSTHLERLVGANLLDRCPLPREDGGTVAVYRPNHGPPETLTAFCLWATQAAGNGESAGPTAAPDPDVLRNELRERFCLD